MPSSCIHLRRGTRYAELYLMQCRNGSFSGSLVLAEGGCVCRCLSSFRSAVNTTAHWSWAARVHERFRSATLNILTRAL